MGDFSDAGLDMSEDEEKLTIARIKPHKNSNLNKNFEPEELERFYKTDHDMVIRETDLPERTQLIAGFSVKKISWVDALAEAEWIYTQCFDLAQRLCSITDILCKKIYDRPNRDRSMTIECIANVVTLLHHDSKYSPDGIHSSPREV